MTSSLKNFDDVWIDIIFLVCTATYFSSYTVMKHTEYHWQSKEMFREKMIRSMNLYLLCFFLREDHRRL